MHGSLLANSVSRLFDSSLLLFHILVRLIACRATIVTRVRDCHYCCSEIPQLLTARFLHYRSRVMNQCRFAIWVRLKIQHETQSSSIRTSSSFSTASCVLQRVKSSQADVVSCSLMTSELYISTSTPRTFPFCVLQNVARILSGEVD